MIKMHFLCVFCHSKIFFWGGGKVKIYLELQMSFQITVLKQWEKTTKIRRRTPPRPAPSGLPPGVVHFAMLKRAVLCTRPLSETKALWEPLSTLKNRCHVGWPPGCGQMALTPQHWLTVPGARAARAGCHIHGNSSRATRLPLAKVHRSPESREHVAPPAQNLALPGEAQTRESWSVPFVSFSSEKTFVRHICNYDHLTQTVFLTGEHTPVAPGHRENQSSAAHSLSLTFGGRSLTEGLVAQCL
jgi:hypothetical protein